jgi:hypothetical protein
VHLASIRAAIEPHRHSIKESTISFGVPAIVAALALYAGQPNMPPAADPEPIQFDECYTAKELVELPKVEPLAPPTREERADSAPQAAPVSAVIEASEQAAPTESAPAPASRKSRRVHRRHWR